MLLRTSLITRLAGVCTTHFHKSLIFHMSTKIEEIKDNLGETVFEKLSQDFKDLGFTSPERMRIMRLFPAVSTQSPDKLQTQLEVLKSMGFKTEEVREMLVVVPELFGADPKVMKSNHRNVLFHMGNHQGRIAVFSSPQTLVDNPFITAEKIDYCLKDMALDKSVIAKSRILRCSLDLIKTRHSFAYRAGLYKRIHPKNQEGLKSNPGIPTLFFTTDEEFIRLFNGLTMEDYIVFEALMNSDKDNYDAEEEVAEREEEEERVKHSQGFDKRLNRMKRNNK